VNATDRTLSGGQEVGRQILARDPSRRPDGVFAANDLLALGIMQVLHEGGVRIPEDIALVGYDDIQFGEVSLIPLTSVRAATDRLGSAAVDLLLDVVGGTSGSTTRPGAGGASTTRPDADGATPSGDDHHHRVFPPQLVARRSSARPSSARPSSARPSSARRPASA
jgi:hypothetical protein